MCVGWGGGGGSLGIKIMEEFMTYLTRQTKEFIDNVSKQIRLLKENISVHHIVVYMDLAKTYNYKNAEEIEAVVGTKHRNTPSYCGLHEGQRSLIPTVFIIILF